MSLGSFTVPRSLRWRDAVAGTIVVDAVSSAGRLVVAMWWHLNPEERGGTSNYHRWLWLEDTMS